MSSSRSIAGSSKRLLSLLRVFDRPRLAALAGLCVGILGILAIRFFTYQPAAQIHYHANFLIYVNGERELFKGPIYYEETAACATLEKKTPEERVHMHDNEGDVVHIHDRAVTWGHFFDNLGWYVGPSYIQTLDKLYVSDSDNKLSVILNGQNLTGISSIANRVIGDRDRLLVDFGNESDSQLNKEFKSVPDTAKEEDESTDPASCGGNQSLTFHDRFTHLF